MVAIKIEDFAGQLPIISPEMLPPNGAQLASDTRLNSMTLRGIRDNRLLHDFDDGRAIRRVFRLQNTSTGAEVYYGSINRFAEVIKNPLVDDAFDRYYLIAEDVPKVATFAMIQAGTAFQNVALGRPAGVVSFTLDGAPPSGTDPAENRVYVVTFQSEWGEETEPSDAASVLVGTDQDLTVENIPQPQVGDITGRAFNKINIYRTVVGSASAEYFFVAEVPLGTTTFFDDIRSKNVVYNRVLDAFENEGPVVMKSGVVHPSGSLVGFNRDRVYFSKPYLPHAWPADLIIKVDDIIVGLVVVEQEIFVVTEGRPAIIFGPDAENMGIRYIPVYEPCIGFNSIVPFSDGCIYMGDQGLIMMTSNGVQRYTDEIVGKDEWVQTFAPTSEDNMTAARHIDEYIYLRGPAAMGYSFANKGLKSIMQMENENLVGYLHNDKLSTMVFAIIGDQVYEWSAPTEPALPYRWRSKVFKTPDPVNFGALIVHFEHETNPAQPVYDPAKAPENAVIINVYAGGVLRFSEQIANSQMRRLPSGFKTDKWEVEILGDKIVSYVALAETGKELEHV